MSSRSKMYVRFKFSCLLLFSGCFTITFLIYTFHLPSNVFRYEDFEDVVNIFDGTTWYYVHKKITRNLDFANGIPNDINDIMTSNNKEINVYKNNISISLKHEDTSCGFNKTSGTWANCNHEQLIFMESLLCHELHIVVMPTTEGEVRQTVQFIRSLLYVRTNPIYFHVMTNNMGAYIFHEVFSTWNIPLLTYSIHESFNVEHTSTSFSKIKFVFTEIISLLPKEVKDAMIIIDLNSRFITNLLPNWKLLVNTVTPFVSVMEFQENNNLIENTKFLMANISDLRSNDSHITVMSSLKQCETIAELNDNISKSLLVMRSLDTWICNLNNELYVYKPRTICDVIVCQNVSHYPKTLRTALNATVLPNSNIPNLTRLCNVQSRQMMNRHTFSSDTNNDGMCTIFKSATSLTFITHRYFLGSNQYWICGERHASSFSNRASCTTTNNQTHHTTLATVFTMSRFHVFEQLVNHWGGPVSAVFFGTPSEIDDIVDIIHDSSILSRRLKTLSVHVVYSHSSNTPLNYLRNIAINESLTRYTFYNDVDLLSIPSLYHKIGKHISNEEDQLSHFSNFTDSRNALVVVVVVCHDQVRCQIIQSP